MLKVAVACENKMVCGHFGHCETFEVFETENGKIVNQESIPNPGHRPGFLPNFLHEIGVNTIISGGMGGGAVDIFNGHNIEVILGAQGDSRRVVEEYLAGNLASTGSVCHEHAHHDECGE
ncbi:MAG: NifB/NifX family molybdenum-iron cluster-binding protein [Sphaerochaeta sp.]|uniref:NifB/NifX family molybdenum-iron cluster-binding protein n=1 Tax=Sphaerochaeta sp. TaxID=1972642 RepID=UPI0029794D20|nr:NifB/NifX family molybdenum-iron cluster-binding protein [uncultured Sphaerochaeta sp.]MDD3057263.1 NifB/NifX family molybdenum-iron cluster-binding protein [Sphaerochaeta sp.]MDD3929332.1 NifB/NifX family molybdenum-iron cluster-binding protein [Sphaerochaeta sp.]